MAVTIPTTLSEVDEELIIDLVEDYDRILGNLVIRIKY